MLRNQDACPEIVGATNSRRQKSKAMSGWTPYRLYFWCGALTLGALQLTMVSLFSVSFPEELPHRQVSELVYMHANPNKRQQKPQHEHKGRKQRRNRSAAAEAKEKPETQVMPIDTRGNNGDEAVLPQKLEPVSRPIAEAGKLYSVGRKDRSGSVITDMMYAHAYAFAHNITYAGACYTKHGLPKKDARELLHDLGWDRFLPFACPAGVGPHLELQAPKAEALSPLIVDEKLYRSSKHLYFNKPWRETIQSLLGSRRKSPGSFEIAVHVRRGDVTPCRYKRRYLPNQHYLRLIDQFIPADRKAHVTVYSESTSFESFDVFKERGFDLKLNTDLAAVWQHLATADVTILSRSFFSFVPAAVNPNTVVYTHFFDFEPLEGWAVADDGLVKESDKEIRRMFDEECDATAIEEERHAEREKHQTRAQDQ